MLQAVVPIPRGKPPEEGPGLHLGIDDRPPRRPHKGLAQPVPHQPLPQGLRPDRELATHRTRLFANGTVVRTRFVRGEIAVV